ncbi:hypothetical protein ASG01_07045 [Chryseobacterium sp. Leaf180]|uniref:T9SS type A sorting domain-containing protein n=1 Tax=Chryseobacterium sp. Leaf180 TaxID=1736289 RepID=UPI0006F45EE1|nr:T9SS type A sorting domain-containing protein [Chryseobacterium sp. Leaf180]KQR95592.1 hypothetical protein ASG01_07045 [Chryseobacterium sp. Leaf180]
MKTKLFSVAAAALLTTASMLTNAQQYQPMPISGGFNADVVANGVGNAAASTNNDVDGVGYAFIARNFQSTATSPTLTYGLPNDGVITSAVTSPAGLTYQLASYSANNSLRLPTALTSTGILTFTTPKAVKNLYMLAVSGSGDSSVNISVNFSDGTSQPFLSVPITDWYGGSNFAIQGIGRITIATNSLDQAGGTNPRLYQIPLAISTANQTKLVQSVTVTKALLPSGLTGGIPNIFALSGDIYNSCEMPTGLTSNTTITGATVLWTAPTTAPASGYQYYVSTSSTAPTATTTPTGSTAAGVTSVTLNSLTTGTTYYIWVRSNCGGSSQSFWTMTQFTPGQISATYTTGDISATLTSATVTTSTVSPCAGIMSVTIPTGYKIGSTNVDYAMSTTNDGYMSEQKSYLTCVTNNTSESSVSSGSGGFTGTFNYSRTGLTIANDLTGTVTFRLNAFKSYGPNSDCLPTFNKVDNNTWKITVTLVPANLATAETSAKAKEAMVYPNPFSDILHIERADKVKIATVTDMSGITVKVIENPSSAIHLEGVKTGVYMLTLDMKDGSKVSTKVIKK